MATVPHRSGVLPGHDQVSVHETLGCVVAGDLQREVHRAHILALRVPDWERHRGAGCLCTDQLRLRPLCKRATLLKPQRLASVLLPEPDAAWARGQQARRHHSDPLPLTDQLPDTASERRLRFGRWISRLQADCTAASALASQGARVINHSQSQSPLLGLHL